MSQNQKVVIITSQKSAIIGFVLNLLGLGFYGLDRLYKGDKWLGLLKFISSINCMIMIAPAVFLLPPLLNGDLGIFDTIKAIFQAVISEKTDENENIVLLFLLFSMLSLFHFCVWWPVDFILVPLGIVKDNARKRAMMK